MRVLRAARGKLGTEGGFTLVEVMVAAAMSVVVVAAASSMLISAVKDQPELTKRAQSVSNARWILARLTREIRNGVVVDKATPSSVSFRTYVRSTTCGSAGRIGGRHRGDQMRGDLHVQHDRLHEDRGRAKTSSRARRRRSSPGSTTAASSATCRAPNRAR